ncbi:MAG: vWA domain-containing protein [Ginsengibacter sp.]
MQKIIKYPIWFLLIILSAKNIFAQQQRVDEKKYIFLLDITKSMFGCCGSPDIFEKVRTHLINAIENISDPNAEIVLSTYQQKIIDTWKVKASAEGKRNLINNLKKISNKNVPGQETNILGAWNEATSHLDNKKINIVFILTDGEHNDPNVPIQKFYDEIPRWKNVSSYQQAYMFIVELTDLAIDNKVREIVAKTKDVQIINGIEFFILEIKEQSPILNTEDDLVFTFGLKKDNWNPKFNDLPFLLDIKSDYFELDKKEIRFSELPLKIRLVPKKPLNKLKEELEPITYVNVEANYPSEKFPQIKLLNNSISVQVNNRKEKVLKIEVIN